MTDTPTKPLDDKYIAHYAGRLSDRQRIIALRKALSTSIGYMTNALIDLQTNTPKRTAIMTIEGGIKFAREALAKEDMQSTLLDTEDK